MSAAETPWAAQLGEYVANLRFDQLPEEVIVRAKLCILDQIANQVKGATTVHSQPAYRLVVGMGAKPESCIVLHEDRSAAPLAAYVNGTFGHSIEFDDAHFKAGHPGTMVVPAAIALAEPLGRSGPELITAVVAGYEIAVRSLGVIHQQLLEAGWHGVTVVGVFAAAAASSSILGLDARTTTHSFGIAGSQASGTMEYDQSGGTIYAVHGGIPARVGVEAGLLAADGLTGPPTIFEGERGMFRLFGAGIDVETPRSTGRQFEILNNIFKLNPAVGTVLAAIDGVAEIMASEALDADSVKGVDVWLADWAVVMAGTVRHPHDVVTAQMSLAYSVAVRICTGNNDVDAYLDPRRWRDSKVWELSDRVEAHVMEITGDMTPLGAIVEIELDDGRRLRSRQTAFKGHHTRPATSADLHAKFDELTNGLLTDTQQAVARSVIDDLEHTKDLGELWKAISVSPGMEEAGSHTASNKGGRSSSSS
jgi:2-methylcitrate dehydratase PrpD